MCKNSKLDMKDELQQQMLRDAMDAWHDGARHPQYKRVLEYLSRYGIR